MNPHAVGLGGHPDTRHPGGEVATGLFFQAFQAGKFFIESRDFVLLGLQLGHFEGQVLLGAFVLLPGPVEVEQQTAIFLKLTTVVLFLFVNSLLTIDKNFLNIVFQAIDLPLHFLLAYISAIPSGSLYWNLMLLFCTYFLWSSFI